MNKKSTRCMNCGKLVTHNADEPPYDFCYYCRDQFDLDDDFELQLWYKWVNKMNIKEE